MRRNFYKIINLNSKKIAIYTDDVKSVYIYFKIYIEDDIDRYIIMKDNQEISFSQILNHRVNKGY